MLDYTSNCPEYRQHTCVCVSYLVCMGSLPLTAARFDWTVSVHGSASQKTAGSQGQKGKTGQKAAQPSGAKASKESDAPGPVEDWIADGTAELEAQGVETQFAVSFHPVSVLACSVLICTAFQMCFTIAASTHIFNV